MDTGLNQCVLVLNRLWQAVNICSARRALCLLYAQHAQVIDPIEGSFQTLDFQEWALFSSEYPDERSVHTVETRIGVPEILLLSNFDRLPLKEVKLTRENIFERDAFICQYTGRKLDRKDLNIDHVIPRDRGGKTTWENVVTCSIEANTRKGNRLPHEAGMTLLRQPAKPKMRPFLTLKNHQIPHESWKHFLDVSRWKVQLSD